MSEWKKVKLGEVTEYITDGDHQPAPKSEQGVYFIKIKDIINNRISFDNALHVPSEYYAKLKNNRKAVKGDVLYTVVGSYGTATYVNTELPFCFERNIALLHANQEINSYFLYLLMSCESFYKKADALANGAAQKLISLKKLQTIEIEIPPLATQHRIATILSRYDSLIENYQKQIKLLEEAAQRLYKEWFIDLHFPGHENTKIVDGVPEGWEKKRLIDLVDVQYGYAFDGKLFNSSGEGMPILRIRNIPDGITSDYTTEEAQDCYIVHNGDIVVGMDGIFHINSWSGGDAYLVQRACSFRPKEECMKGFIFQAIQEPIKFFEKTLVGATVAHLGKKHIDSIELCIPKNFELYKPFSKFYNQRQGLLSQIRLLTEARDRLLPKLMSGEINVES